MKDSISVSKTNKSGIFLIKIFCMRKSQMWVPSSLLKAERVMARLVGQFALLVYDIPIFVIHDLKYLFFGAN